MPCSALKVLGNSFIFSILLGELTVAYSLRLILPYYWGNPLSNILCELKVFPLWLLRKQTVRSSLWALRVKRGYFPSIQESPQMQDLISSQLKTKWSLCNSLEVSLFKFSPLKYSTNNWSILSSPRFSTCLKDSTGFLSPPFLGSPCSW